MKLFKSSLLAIVIVVAFIIVSGCVGMKPPPTVIHADNYTAEPLDSQQVIPPADRVLGLKEAIRIALANNPDYKRKYLAVVTAWASLYTELAAFSPEIGVDYKLGQVQGSAPTTSTSPFSNVITTYSSKVYGTWNLFKGFQTVFASLSAYESAKSAEELEINYRRILIYLVTVNYNDILKARATIRIELSNEAFQLQQLKDIQLKYNAGASSLSELLNFEILATDAKDRVVTATANYKIYRYTLAKLMGLTTADLPEETQFPPIEVSESEEYSLGVEFYLDLAINQRPDLKSARLNLNALRYTLYQTWGKFSPTADFSMNYGFIRPNNNTNWGKSQGIPRGQDLAYNYDLTLDWKLWQGGSRIAAVRAAQANMDSQEEEVMNTWLTVVQEVRSAYTRLLENETHRILLKKAMEMSKQRRDLVTEEYNAGNTDITNLNQIQFYFVSNELSHLQALINVVNSRAKLKEATGTNFL